MEETPGNIKCKKLQLTQHVSNTMNVQYIAASDTADTIQIFRLHMYFVEYILRCCKDNSVLRRDNATDPILLQYDAA